MEISHHARQRIYERAGISSVSEQNKLVEYAYKNGLKLKRFKGEFYDFLCSKQLDYGTHTIRTLVDERLIFVFDNANGGKLCTVYNVPEQFVSVKDYIVKSGDCTRCFIAIFDDKNDICEFIKDGCLVDDIGEATEFRSHESAQNCIKNNKNVARRVAMGCDVEIIDL